MTNGKTIQQMREENPNFDRDLERTFAMADAAAAKKNTPAELIAEYHANKLWLKQATDRFAEMCKPRLERQQQIEGALHEQLLALNNGALDGKRASFSTEAGTAYLSTIVTPRIVDKEKWLDWVLEDWDNRGPMLAIGNPVKAGFDEYVGEHKQNPPFTETSSITRVNIRST